MPDALETGAAKAEIEIAELAAMTETANTIFFIIPPEFCVVTP